MLIDTAYKVYNKYISENSIGHLFNSYGTTTACIVLYTYYKFL